MTIDRDYWIIIIGLILTLIAFLFWNLYITGFMLVLTLTFAMCVAIMKSSGNITIVTAHLTEDTKGLSVTNEGNKEITDIQILLIPYDIETKIETLAADETKIVRFEQMIGKAKVVIRYKNHEGKQREKTIKLFGPEEECDDPLKPVFPMFSWK